MAALEEAWHSVFGDADATLAAMVETIRREPWAYVQHLVSGTLTSVWEQAKGLVTFLVDAVKAVATSAICLQEQLVRDLRRSPAGRWTATCPSSSSPSTVGRCPRPSSRRSG